MVWYSAVCVKRTDILKPLHDKTKQVSMAQGEFETIKIYKIVKNSGLLVEDAEMGIMTPGLNGDESIDFTRLENRKEGR